MPYLDPQANAQRNSIAQTMMNVANPPPQVSVPMLPQGRSLMGMPQMPPPGAPPVGVPPPQTAAPALPLSLGVPPQPPMMQQPGAMPQPQQPMPMPQPQGVRGY